MLNSRNNVYKLTDADNKTLVAELTKYAEEGASDQELTEFRDAFISAKKKSTPQSAVSSTVPKQNSASASANGSSASTNFEKRLYNPSLKIKNADGSESTHKMMSFEADGKFYAAPTIVEIDGKLKELSQDEAIRYALTTGEYKQFKSDKEAQEYAKGGYKKGTTLDPFGARTNPFAGKSVTFDKESLNKSPQEKAQEERIKAAGKAIKPAVSKAVPVDNSSQYPEGSMAWTQEKLKQDPLYTENYNKLKQAEQLDPDRIRAIEQEVDDEINGKGFVNTLKSAGRGLSSFFTNFTFNTDPLTEEREQAKKELQQQKVKATPEILNEKAREIAIRKRIDSERNSQIESYLTSLEDQKDEFGVTKREDLYRFQAMEASTLSQKDKMLVKKQEVLMPALETALADAAQLEADVKKLQAANQPVPDDLRESYASAVENYNKLQEDAIATQAEFAANEKELGDAQENLDLLKRNYGNWKNFEDNALASVMDLYAGAAGFADYASTMTGRPLDALAARGASKKLKEGSDNVREGIMKPKSVEDINSWEDFGRWAANTGAQQVPIAALVATPGGVGAIGLTSTGQKFEAMQEEIASGEENYSPVQMGLIPAGFGLAEAGSSYVDRLLFKQAGRVIRSATDPEKRLIAKGFARQIFDGGKAIGIGTVMEASEEAATQLVQNLMDIYAGGKEDVGVWDNVTDAAAAGALFGAMIPFGGQIIAKAAKPFTTEDTAEKTAAQLELLSTQLANPELSESGRLEVEKQYKATEAQLKKEMAKTEQRIASLSNEDFAEILTIKKEQSEIQKSARDTEADPTINEDAKKLLLGNLKKEFDAREERRVAILDGTLRQSQGDTPSNDSQISQPTENKESSEKSDVIPNTNQIDDEGKTDPKTEVNPEPLEAMTAVTNKLDSLFETLTKNGMSKEEAEIAAVNSLTKQERDTLLGRNTQNNESTPANDTITDGDVRVGTEPVGEAGTEQAAAAEDLQSAADSGAGQAQVKEYRLTNNARPYSVSFNNGKLDIKDSAGKEPSAPTRRKLEDKYAEEFDFTAGPIAPAIEDATVNPSKYIAETSENPAEIAQALLAIDNEALFNENIDYVDRIIAENIGKVSRQSFIDNSDVNNIGMSLAKSYLSKDGKPLDTLAQELSETAGREITEQDIVDFMLENPNGPQSLFSKVKRENRQPLEQKFAELTGLPPRERYLQKAVEQQSAKDEFVNSYMTSLDVLSDEELLSLQNEIALSEQQEYGTQERTITGTTGTIENADSGTGEERSGIQGEARRDDRSEAAEDGGVEQASQSRNRNLITERIKPERRAPKNTPKKLNRIIADVSKGLKATLIYGRSRRSGSIGTYNPSNALIRIKNAGDIDTVAHEIGHMIDDRYNLLDTIPSESEVAAIRELTWFSERGGSNPPAKLSPAKKAKYLEREGMGEFFRAYVANPTQTRIIAPTLTEHFENTLDDTAMAFVKQFSDDYLDFANATAGEKLMSNIEDLDAKEASGFRQWLDKFKSEDGRLQITPWDNLSAHVLNSLGIANKAFDFLTKQAGETNLLPEKNFEMMARLFAGVNGKTNRILADGMVDGKNKKILDKDGNPINVEWLLEPLDNTSEATVKSDMEEVIRYLVAERTLEYAKKFGRLDNLTGIGGGIDADIDVAQEYLNDFDALKSENKEKYNRIKEAAKRYRKFADLGLRYAVDKGRISEATYQQIKESNQYYVSLARVMENAPMDEQEPFFNENGGGIASVKDIIKKAKGGTAFIQNPYISLLQNTVNIIKEADRNEVLSSFIEPMQKLREMGDGTPTDFSQVARPASTGDKNVKTIFVDGNVQRWQFAPEIFNALTSMEKVTDSPYTELLSKPANLIRFTVTNFPTFALRNAVRDTTSRMIVSRTNSGFKDLVQSASDKELFELYGGSQAGFYHTNKEGYQQKMKESIKEITKTGGIVLNPKQLYRGYRKLLERGENLNRIAEFKSAYRKAKANGLDDYNAGLYAAYQARDLMDFAVAGHTIRQLNRIIPFLNAGVQGLARSAKAAKENPTGFAVKTALYTVLPSLLFRQLITAMGDDEEYEELPAYQRDLFWNFKTPFTGDVWVSIPKPFEQGMISSAIDRGYSQAAGSETAWDGFGGSVVKSLTPFDESSLLGGIKPFYEVASNYNYFTDRNIVPAWEEGKMMELRAGKEKASRTGKGIAAAFDEAGITVDPRKVDHILTGYGTYMADWGLALGDLGVENSRFKFGPSKTGFAKDVPINNSVSVTAVYKLATELGKWSSLDVKGLRDMIEKYYLEEDAAKREKLSKDIYAKAKEIRKEFEADKAEIESGKPKKKLTPAEQQAKIDEAMRKARERK